MSYVLLNQVSHYFGGQDIFREINFAVDFNSRFGLIGRNGSGKTTLFDIISGKITPVEGTVQIAKGKKVCRLTQEPELDPDLSLRETLLAARPEWVEIHTQLEAARARTAANPSEENRIAQVELEERFDAIDGYNIEYQLKNVLINLGLEKMDQHQPVGLFSGGEQTRIQLAGILLTPFDLLLLDEPTNHLDFAMIHWLGNFLVKQDKPYVIISHDRGFLDQTVTRICEIRDKRIIWYGGNYSTYRQELERRNDEQEKLYKRQQVFIKKTEDFIRRNMAGQKVSQAKSRLKMLEKLDIVEKPAHERAVKVKLESHRRSGNDVFRIHKGAFGYDGKMLVSGIELNVFYQDRVALVGRNGCGKTTFLRILNGERGLDHGRLHRGASLDIGYFDQMHIQLDSDRTVFETIQGLMPGATRGDWIGYCARFGFYGDDLEKPALILSGGEKARLYLAKLVFRKPNLLILDEPTNHLDLPTIENLEKALQEFEGTVIFVSHDVTFIRNVATRYWHFHDGVVEDSELPPEELMARQLQKKRTSGTDNRPRQQARRVNPLVLENILNEIDELETALEGHYETLSGLEEQYADPKTYTHPEKVKSLQARIDELKGTIAETEGAIEELETRYLALTEEDPS